MMKITKVHHGRVNSREKKPEELASLEALDGEGEYCWPEPNRTTRWGKR